MRRKAVAVLAAVLAPAVALCGWVWPLRVLGWPKQYWSATSRFPSRIMRPSCTGEARRNL